MPQHPNRASVSFFRRPAFAPARWIAPILSLALVAGCGQTGAPLPPSLRLPAPVADLAVSRVGDRVTLSWTMPRRTTDKLPLKGLEPVQICRRTNDGACVTVGTVGYEPGKTASYEDHLPPDLTGGGSQLLAYTIEVLSLRGRSAGASNIAYTASGSAPPPFMRARGEIGASGVVLRWQPDSLTGTEHKIKIERILMSAPPPSRAEGEQKPQSPFGAVPLAKQQDLVVRLPPGADPGQALDPDAAFDQRYSYRISRVSTVEVSGKSIDVEGPWSAEIVVDTKDVFPPAAPTGLAAVAAPEEGAIDLSWSPNLEPDLAGYAVYRGEPGGEALRVSPPDKPLDTPGFRDTTAQPGREYAYSVAAIDRDGNQSRRSAEVKETLPPKQTPGLP